MLYDLIIRNGTLVTPTALTQTDIAVADGRIVEVAPAIQGTSKAEVDAAAFDLKLAEAWASSLVDFGLWGGIVPGNLEHLDELAERGVVGFKAFMSNSGIDDFEASDDLTLYEGMARAAKLGCIVAVHA